mmetsp:Transcript_142614/g.259276  ORF Transcript_142614/g.259276 Transcript_142614/m.259276 type:complete len:473 (-) Transcript_142614:60-1478(-)
MLRLPTVLVTVALAATAHAQHVWDFTENINCGSGELKIGPMGKRYQSIGPMGPKKGGGDTSDGYLPVLSDVYTYPDKIIVGGDQEDAFEAGDTVVVREDTTATANLLGPKNITGVEVKESAYGSQTFLYFEGGAGSPYLESKWLFRKQDDSVPTSTTTAPPDDSDDLSEDEDDLPPAACEETCDASTKCAGFMYLKNEKKCYFRTTTNSKRNKDNNRDCWTKVKDPAAGGIDPDTANMTCQAGTCTGQKFFVFNSVPDVKKCGGICLKEKLKGHKCTYFTYSSATKYCFLYTDCPTVEKSGELAVPEDVNLEIGDTSTYTTCKYTVFTVEKWVDLKGLATRQISEAAGGKSSRAIDGNLRSDWGGRSCTHTHRHENPWWEVDFKKDTRVDAVRVLNRGDCCEGRLQPFNVKVDGVLCADGAKPGKGSFADVDCGVTGKTLRIELGRTEWFTICEVQVKQLEIMDISNQTWLL